MKLFLITLAAMSVISIVTIQLFMLAYRNLRSPDRAKTQRRLRKMSVAKVHDSSGPVDILRQAAPTSDIPWFNRVLLHTPGVRRLTALVDQANVSYPPSVFLLLALVLAFLAYLLAFYRTANIPMSILIAAAFGYAPFFYLRRRKNSRLEKFTRQLPEALDLVARGLKAGHAFTTGLKLAADQFDDPIGTEFSETLNEINFGVSVADALKNLAYRVDCPDLKFFVISVIVQRETGGNLAELIEGIARLLRERFAFQDRCRVLSAEARFSANVLIALPLLVIGVLSIINPEFLDPLMKERSGKILLACAGFMMVTGVIVMYRMVRIKV